jgi:hypothetical protein
MRFYTGGRARVSVHVESASTRGLGIRLTDSLLKGQPASSPRGRTQAPPRRRASIGRNGGVLGLGGRRPFSIVKELPPLRMTSRASRARSIPISPPEYALACQVRREMSTGFLTRTRKLCTLCAPIESGNRIDREGTSKRAMRISGVKTAPVNEPGGLRKEKQSWPEERRETQGSWATWSVCR